MALEKHSPEWFTSKLDRFLYIQKERREYDRLFEEYVKTISDDWTARHHKLQHIQHFIKTAGTYYNDRSEEWHAVPEDDAKYRFYASIEEDLLSLIKDLVPIIAKHEFKGGAKS